MEIQHVNVKLMVSGATIADLEPLIPVFHRWIQGQVFDELLLDIADYGHVPQGPGVVLIGYQADYGVDDTRGELGVRYNRKAPLDGTNQTRLKQAACCALKACQRLESEAALDGKIRFDGRGVEVFVNDRILAPNNEQNRKTLDPEFRSFFSTLFRGSDYALAYDTDPRHLLGVTAKSSKAFSVAELIANLGV